MSAFSYVAAVLFLVLCVYLLTQQDEAQPEIGSWDELVDRYDRLVWLQPEQPGADLESLQHDLRCFPLIHDYARNCELLYRMPFLLDEPIGQLSEGAHCERDITFVRSLLDMSYLSPAWAPRFYALFARVVAAGADLSGDDVLRRALRLYARSHDFASPEAWYSCSTLGSDFIESVLKPIVQRGGACETGDETYHLERVLACAGVRPSAERIGVLRARLNELTDGNEPRDEPIQNMTLSTYRYRQLESTLEILVAV